MSGGNASRRRWWLWLPLLGVAGWLALFGDKAPDGNSVTVSEPVRPLPAAEPVSHSPRDPAPKTVTAAGPEPLEALVRRDQWASPAAADKGSPPRRDLFVARNWNPPPAPAPVVEPAPVAPPLPFVFLGKKLEGDSWEVYLARAEQTFVVREGQTLDGIYRVDKIAPPLLALTHLPLGQAQTLMIGDSR